MQFVWSMMIKTTNIFIIIFLVCLVLYSQEATNFKANWYNNKANWKKLLTFYIIFFSVMLN